ncbi:MAG: hypothetical protein DHS20C14_18100 [Phycisphaeraceae bacterium]|nr:MAG: hypothetical protein DHS20C14_18100 [Phycisphaeraceae bacterium]
MSLQGGRGMIVDARRDLLARWDRVTDVWDDANARAFEKRYIEPVDRHVRQAAEAMEKLAAVLDRARRECE